MSEPEAVEPEPEPLGGPSADDLLAEIQKRVQQRVAEGKAEEAEPAPEPEPEPELEPEQEAVPEPNGETHPAAEPEPLTLEELQVKLAEVEAREDKFKKIAGREAGRSGYLEQQLAKLNERLDQLQKSRTTPREDEGTAYAEAGDIGQVLETVDALKKRFVPVATYMTNQAINEAGMDFIRSTPDAQEIGQEVYGVLARDHAAEFREMAESGDPVMAKARAAELLESAYLRVKREKLSAALEQAKKARADQATSVRKSKLEAAPASTGGGKAAPRPRTKTLDTTEDILAEIKRRARAAP
jgi:hypothetical protein